MRVLFAVVPGVGHLNPLLPLAVALRGAGHRVRFATSPLFAADVQRAGFEVDPVGRPFLLSRLSEYAPEISGLQGDERTAVVYRRAFTGPIATEVAADLVRLHGREPYDVVVCDAPNFAAIAAATVVGVPVAKVAIASLSVHVAYQERFTPEIQALWGSVGLAPTSTAAVVDRDLMISPVPADVFFGDFRMPSTLHEVRMESYESDASPPSWIGGLGTRPAIYATLGTVQNKQPAVFRAIIDGLAGEDLDVVVTTGNDLDPHDLGVLPANVRAERFVPQAALLPHCAAVISHAGSGSVRGAAWFGLPQVLIPFAADQPTNAEALSSRGLAIALDWRTLTPEDVRHATRTVLDDPGYRERAAAAARRMRELPGVEAAVELVENLA